MSDDDRRRIDLNGIQANTVAYYDRRPVLGDGWIDEPVGGPFPDPLPEFAARDAAIRRVVNGKRALELGCGSGEATRVAAAVAQHILALDTSATCIDIAKRDPWDCPIEFRVGDAYELASLPSDFTAAFSSGLFHLVPKARYEAFFAGLHARLLPGSSVFMWATHARTLRAKKRLFRAEGSPDLFCARDLTDGSVYNIVNNEFDAYTLAAVFGPRGTQLDICVGDAGWWLTYVV